MVNTPLEPAARAVHAAARSLFFTAKCYQLARQQLAGKCGLEVGGPSFLFDTTLPVYRHIQALDNCVFAEVTHWEGARAAGQTFRFDSGKRTGNNFVTEGVRLEGIGDDRYDFVLASHCLEHIANPIKALHNWKRVLRPGGGLLLVLPDVHRSFEYRRPLTTLCHLVEDYARDVGEQDMTHVREFLEMRDYRKFPVPDLTQYQELCWDNYRHRLVHHHTFDLPSALRMVNHSARLKVLSAERLRPNHLIVFSQKQ